MGKILKILLTGLLIIGYTNTGCQTVKFNKDLNIELKEMAEIDQIAAFIPQGKYKELTEQEWNSFKDSVYSSNQKRIKEIFDKYGFIGFDLAGKDGANNFWLIVQHSDHNPDFQKKVLDKMKIEVDKGNADPSNYGLLVDRVRINTGQKQIYGTQVTYNDSGQAYCKNLEDSLYVDIKRKSIGLEPLIDYLNAMTKMHFDINKQYFLNKGITEPNLYKIKK